MPTLGRFIAVGTLSGRSNLRRALGYGGDEFRRSHALYNANTPPMSADIDAPLAVP